MVINILSTHRFHLLDLARELSSQGNDVRYYSYVPTRRCAEFGIDPAICSNFLWLVWPFFLLEKIWLESYKEHLLRVRNHLIDWYVAHTMRRCEVCIGLGYVYQQSLVEAKHKWKALTILEWGSLHIVEQLRGFGRLNDYPRWKLRWEENGYNVSDYISVASLLSADTFLQHGIPSSRLYVNPYGVDLSQFHPTVRRGNYDLLYVGGWRKEKGCDLLTALCQQYKYRLLHVGAIVNLPFPDDPGMKHIDSVDQNQLSDYYQQARVFVFPSRADGFGMVLIQAVACGLPIVCSQNTGIRDLRKAITSQQWMIEMEDLSVESLHQGIEAALALSSTQTGLRDYAGQDIHNLTWQAYGQRYNQWLQSVLPSK